MNKYIIVAALIVLTGVIYKMNTTSCQSCEGFGTMPQLRLPVYYSRQGYAMKSYPEIPMKTTRKSYKN
jgi:hypothetical protein